MSVERMGDRVNRRILDVVRLTTGEFRRLFPSCFHNQLGSTIRTLLLSVTRLVFAAFFLAELGQEVD